MVELGLAPSRARAQALIMAAKVLVDGQPVTKAAHPVPPQADIELKEKDHPFVSRGGLKLVHGLDHFGLDPSGLRCLDVGASTGGFTDCLLQNGAGHVVAVDVGYGQLDWRLREDDRVTVLERTNGRHLAPEMIGGPVKAAVTDVSFISLTLILPPMLRALEPDGWLIALIKPQFEAGREQVGKGGVVRDPAVHQAVQEKILNFLEEAGVRVLGLTPSPIKGPKGNREFLIAAAK